MTRPFLLSLTFVLSGFIQGQSPSHYSYKGKSLGSNTVYNLCEFNHCIYAATEHGIVKIDQGKTTIFRDESAVKNSYTLLQVGPDGNLYTLNFRNQIYRVTDEGLKPYLNLRGDFKSPVLSYHFFQNYLYVNSNVFTLRYAISTLKKDSTWQQIGTVGEGHIEEDTLFLGRLKITEDSVLYNVEQMQLMKRHQSTVSDLFLTLKTASTQFLVINGNLYTDQGQFANFSSLLPDATNLHYLKLLDKNHLWLSTNAGALIFDLNDRNNISVLFSEHSISDLLLDEQGKIWIGTLGDGIKVIPDVRIKQYLPPSIISAFTTHQKGESYFGTITGGIYKLNNLNETALCQVNSKVNALYANGEQLYISNLKAYALYSKGILKHSSHRSPKADRILNIGNLMLFSSWHGVELTHTDLTPYDSLNHFLSAHTAKINNSTRLKAHLSPLWISPELDRLIGLQNGKIVAYENVSIPESIKGKEFSDLQVHQSVPFLLTPSGEVWTYNVAKDQFEKRHEINHAKGCQRLAVNTSGCFIYEEGIVHYITNDSQYAYAGLSRFKHEEVIEFAANQSHLFVVYRNEIHELPIHALLRTFEAINLPLELIVDGQLLAPSADYSIQPGDHSIMIRFNYFDEMQSLDTYFSYQINGKRWTESDDRNRLLLNGLSSGLYTLKIKIDRPVGPPIYKSISFEIRRYWYETIWFNLGLSLLVLLLVISYFLRRIKSIRKRQRMENEIVHARIAKINAQMKPHFIFNVLTSIQSMILKEDRFKASNAIGEFAQFIRSTLDISKRESITVQQELEITEKYIKLEQQRQIKPFDYQINKTTVSSQVLQMVIPPLILQPYVENAIIHGLHHLSDRKGKLDINLEEANDLLRFTVIDNGVGRANQPSALTQTSKRHDSFANAANFNRLALIKGARIQIDDLDEGTKITLEIPIVK